MQLSPEQQSAVTRTGQDACCVAGPGSGKTRVLVERFAWLIDTGIGPESILAITFTEKAAHELKSRLVTRFESDVQTRQQIEQAPVSTIHGLCQSILREHAIAAGLDPEFGILDQWQAVLELDAAIRAVLDRMARESTAAFRDLIGAWASEDPAGDLSTVYTAVRMSGGLAQLLAAPPDLEPLLPERAGQCIELLRQSAAALNPSTGPQRRHLSSLQELIAAFDSLEPAEWLATLAGVNLQGKGKMAGADELKQARGLAKEALPIAVWIRHKDHRAALTRLLLDLDAEFRGRLRLIPALDFAALEEHTLALLKSQPEVRASLQQRFKAILMDEVQDTNPIQWDIVKLLRSSNNFFAVGDANQAIYGFRHADPGLFAQYQAEVESGGGVIDRLERNYRSRPEILEAVARFSDSGFAPGITAHRLLEADGPFSPKTVPSIEIQRIDGTDNADESEAMWLAARLVELKRKLLVDDPPRPLAWSDCAVLARTSAPFDAIEAAFERFGIPCVVARGRNFFEEPEILDLTNWLRVMESSANQPALFGLLRSPFFGYSDERIFLLKQGGEFPPAEARERIEAMRALRGQVPAGLILSRFAHETGYFVRLGPGGRANFEKFLDRLRELESSHPGDYAAWIGILSALAAEEESNAPQTGSMDAVQILSIHKSKGLEFPLIAIVGMDRGTGNDTCSLNYSAAHGLGAKWRDGTGLGSEPDFAFNMNPRTRSQAEDDEADRLLYVAMTRAKSHLLLSWRGDSGRSRWPGQIEQAWALEWPETFGEAAVQDGVRLVRLSGLPEIDRQEMQAPAAPVEWRDPLPETFHVQPVVTATDLARFHVCPYRYFLARVVAWPGQPNEFSSRPQDIEKNVDDVDFDDPAETGGAELGRQVHALLAGQIFAEPSPQAIRLVENFRASDMGRLALQSPRVEHEFDFLFDFQGTLIRGAIDLWFESPGEIRLVDYKTGHPGRDRQAEYRLQVQIYSLALRRLYPGKPIRAFLYLLEENRPVEVETGDQAELAVRRALGYFKEAGERGEYPAQPGKQCDFCRYWKSPCPGRDTVTP